MSESRCYEEQRKTEIRNCRHGKCSIRLPLQCTDLSCTQTLIQNKTKTQVTKTRMRNVTPVTITSDNNQRHGRRIDELWSCNKLCVVINCDADDVLDCVF